MFVNWIAKESDLGIHLSQSLSAQNRARFDFLLAALNPQLISEPVAESQFETLLTQQQAPIKKRPFYASTEDWRGRPTQLFMQSMADWLLNDCMHPEALTAKPNAEDLPLEVQANSPHWLMAIEKNNNDVKQAADLIDLLDKIHHPA